MKISNTSGAGFSSGSGFTTSIGKEGPRKPRTSRPGPRWPADEVERRKLLAAAPAPAERPSSPVGTPPVADPDPGVLPPARRLVPRAPEPELPPGCRIIETPHGPHLVEADGKVVPYQTPEQWSARLHRRPAPEPVRRGAWSAWTGR